MDQLPQVLIASLTNVLTGILTRWYYLKKQRQRAEIQESFEFRQEILSELKELRIEYRSQQESSAILREELVRSSLLRSRAEEKLQECEDEVERIKNED